MKSPYLLILVLGISIHTCFAAADKKKTAIVRTLKTEKLYTELLYPGLVRSTGVAQIKAIAQSYVKEIPIHLGAKVKKGQRILTLKHNDPIYQYRSIPVVSPINGIVAKINTSLGSFVSKGQNLLTVVDDKKNEIVVEVPGRDLKKVSIGAKAIFQGASGTTHVKAVGVAPQIDFKTGTAQAVFHIEDTNKERLVLGDLGNVELKTNQRTGIAIPSESVFYKAKKSYVKIVKEGKLYRKNVELGEIRRNNIEVLKGLKAGDTLVIRTNGFAADGSEVKVEHEKSL